MNPLWTKIGLGATVIFGVGLAGITAINKGKSELVQFLGRAGTRIPLKLGQLDFEVEGRRIGAIKAVDIRHGAPGTSDGITIDVAVEDPARLVGLAECNLTAGYDGHWSGDDGFRCAAATEMGDLVPMGSVRFLGGDLERPLYLPERVTRRLDRSGLRALEASLTTDAGGGVTANGRFDVVDRQHSIESGSFSLRASDAGTELSVRGHNGRALLDIRAGESGVSVNINELQGKRLLRLIEELKN